MLHLGLLHGVIFGVCVSVIIGSDPAVTCVVFWGDFSNRSSMSNCCSIVGFTFALIGSFLSVGSASETNLGRRTRWLIVEYCCRTTDFK